jgi:predicted amidohydrolase
MRSLPVAAIQTGPCSDDVEQNVGRALDLLARAVEGHGARLVMFNELFNTKFFAVKQLEHFDQYFETIPGPTTQKLSSAARSLGVAVVAGIAEKTVSGQYYNSAAVIDEAGKLVGVYRKTHIPLMAAPPERATYEANFFRPGDLGLPVFDVAGTKVGLVICYDRHFPETFRSLAMQGAEIIGVPSGARTWNANWRSGIWESLLRTRAYENGVFVVAPNRAGEEDGTRYLGASMIVSPIGGKVIAQAPPGAEDYIVFADLDLDEVKRFGETVHFRRDIRPEIYTPTQMVGLVRDSK